MNEWTRSLIGCDCCCNKDGCDSSWHWERRHCPYCQGQGWYSQEQAQKLVAAGKVKLRNGWIRQLNAPEE